MLCRCLGVWSPHVYSAPFSSGGVLSQSTARWTKTCVPWIDAPAASPAVSCISDSVGKDSVVGYTCRLMGEGYSEHQASGLWSFLMVASPRAANARVIGCVVLAVVSCLAILFSCKRQQPSPPVASPSSLHCFQEQLKPGELLGWNLLFVTLDTTRADRIGCYGYAGAETPTIDGLAARGVTFDHAVTSVPSTLPSHSTMMTGLDAPNHGVRTNAFFTLDETSTTLAEVLKDHGYATTAFVSTYVLHGRFGLRQGFDTYDHIGPGTKRSSGPRRAKDVTDLAIAWLTKHLQEKPQQPWFMWPHYFDPHAPYDPPGEYAARFADRLYDGEIAYTDAQLGRLLEFLKGKKQIERTLIVLTADHGEGLGDHLEESHSRLIYDTTVHIPFIMSCPQLHNSPCRIDDVTVGTIDIMPTVLRLLGVETDLTFDGFDLLTTVVSPDRGMYLETLSPLVYHGWASLHGLRTVSAKYIDAPHPEYYDLATDPDELVNLLEPNVEVGNELARRLTALMSGWPPPDQVAGTATPLSKHEAERLAALGYVTTDVSDGSGDTLRADPKDMVPLYKTLTRANAATMNSMAWETVASPESDSGACRRAVILARMANHKEPGNATYMTTLGVALYRAGKYAEAAEALVEAENLLSTAGQQVGPAAMAFKAMALYQLGRSEQARAELRRLQVFLSTNGQGSEEVAGQFLQEAETTITAP